MLPSREPHNLSELCRLVLGSLCSPVTCPGQTLPLLFVLLVWEDWATFGRLPLNDISQSKTFFLVKTLFFFLSCCPSETQIFLKVSQAKICKLVSERPLIHFALASPASSPNSSPPAPAGQAGLAPLSLLSPTLRRVPLLFMRRQRWRSPGRHGSQVAVGLWRPWVLIFEKEIMTS